jgi:hypothetical protein
LFAHGRWFSPGTPAFSTTKTGRHDITDILLNVTLNTERTTDPGQATGKLYHLRLRVECPLFCNVQNWARTHAVLVIGLYELLDPTCTRLAAASDNVYQLFAHGWWFSPGTPAFSTTKTGRHDITVILLNVTLNTNIQKSICQMNHKSKK